ncbi:hypothetical protein GOBAR_AA04259 [Gossypium barbadense]|uniref:Uncharacterized protein n=1 Tax=Gossypium barbadense TaxID=3634 RepID=A0A2P5YL99_GOSBA|nr:hypothetical protein GOBAR_AA04259 [Gossypium barbadense]
MFPLAEVKEHWRRQHPRRLLLMVHVARARHRPCLFHRPRDSALDGAVHNVIFKKKKIVVPTLKKRKGTSSSAGPTFRLGELVRQLSVSEFGAALDLYTEEVKEENELHALARYIHFSPSKCWHTLAPDAASYNLSHSKELVLPPSLHEDPPTQPPPLSRPFYAAASYADISKRLTRFEQQCFQRLDNIDATLQQICQHLHISSPVPPREPSSDEDEYSRICGSLTEFLTARNHRSSLKALECSWLD